MNGKYSELPYTPCPPRGMASPSVHTPPEGTFIITDEPALTRHDHSEPTVHIGVRSRHVAQSTGFDKCAMTHIQHRNVAQNGFTASEILHARLVIPASLTRGDPRCFCSLQSFAFPRMPCRRNGTLCSLLRLAFFT